MKEHTPLREVYDFGIFYHQLIVSDESAAPIPNDWREQHVAQGFAWRPGTVSFATLGDLGDLRVEVRVADDLDVLPGAVRAIVVPFAVSPPGRVGLSDTVDDVTTRVAPGEYALLCEMGYLGEEEGEEAEWCRLTFVPSRDTQPEVLRADESLFPQYPLLMEADPVWAPSYENLERVAKPLDGRRLRSGGGRRPGAAALLPLYHYEHVLRAERGGRA